MFFLIIIFYFKLWNFFLPSKSFGEPGAEDGFSAYRTLRTHSVHTQLWCGHMSKVGAEGCNNVIIPRFYLYTCSPHGCHKLSRTTPRFCKQEFYYLQERKEISPSRHVHMVWSNVLLLNMYSLRQETSFLPCSGIYLRVSNSAVFRTVNISFVLLNLLFF